MSTYSIRIAAPEDRRCIVPVLAEYLPALDAEQRYDWLYAANPHGRALTWIATDDASGEIAGITSFFRRNLLVNGEPRGGALGGDGYVRPAFRRRGIGEAMHAASRAAMVAAGIDVMFGTPMPANVTPLAKVGAKTITDVIRYVRPLSGRAFRLEGLGGRLLTRLLTPRARAARLEPAREHDPRIDECWAAMRPELRLTTVRDAAFYTWRFLRSPSQKQRAWVVLDRAGRVLAACALDRVDHHIRIVDLVAPARHWGRALAAIAAHADGCDAIEIKLTREDGRARHLLRHGFLPREPKPFNLLLPAGDPRADVYFDPTRWYFTWAESDQDQFL